MAQVADILKLARAALRPRGAKHFDQIQVPELERAIPPSVQNGGRLAALRALTKYPDDGRLPLTLPQIAAFPSQFLLLADPSCTVPVAGLIHVGMKIRQHRPIGAGERLGIVTRTANGRSTARGYEFDLVTEGRIGADTVWNGTASILVRKPAPAAKSDKARPEKTRTPETPPPGATETTWRVNAETIRAYARASGDLNPIHLSAATARLFGMPKAVAHGMWSLTRLAGTAMDLLVKDELALDASFKLPLFVPGTALARTYDDGGGVRHLKLFDADGVKPHVTATLKAEAHRD